MKTNWTIEQLTAAVRARELYAKHALTFAANGFEGRQEKDPEYIDITEGRDVGAMQQKYSSCGDLPHWLLEGCGVRFPWVNRAALGQYAVGMNVARIQSMAHELAPPSIRVFESLWIGDVLIVWNSPKGLDAHVIVATGPLQNGVLPTVEMGQPGAVACMRIPKLRPDGWYIGTRRVQKILKFAATIEAAARAGKLELLYLERYTKALELLPTDAAQLRALTDLRQLLHESGELSDVPEASSNV